MYKFLEYLKNKVKDDVESPLFWHLLTAIAILWIVSSFILHKGF